MKKIYFETDNENIVSILKKNSLIRNGVVRELKEDEQFSIITIAAKDENEPTIVPLPLPTWEQRIASIVNDELKLKNNEIDELKKQMAETSEDFRMKLEAANDELKKYKGIFSVLRDAVK